MGRLADLYRDRVREVCRGAAHLQDVGPGVDPPAARGAAFFVGSDQWGGGASGAQGFPARVTRVPAGEGPVGELEGDRGPLAGAEVDLGEGPELARRAGELGRGRLDVELDDLAAGSVAGVRDRDLDREGVSGREGLGRDARAADLEGGVGQAVAEREADGERAGVVPAVAHEDPLAVADLAVLAGEV